LALLLALLMVFTATGMQVFANDGTDTDDTEQVEENTPVVEESKTETTPAPEVETTTTPEQTTTVETPTETTTDTTTTVDTNTDQTNGTPTEPTEPAEPSETTDGSTEDTEGETAEEPTTPPDPLDLTSYIKKSSMNVTSGDTPYAIDGQTVPSMEVVSVTLEFGEVTGLAQGQKLVYNIPQSYVQADTISESNTDKNKVLYRTSASTSEPVYQVIGTFTLDASGKVTITPDEKYLTENGTVELPGGQFTFTGMLSSQLGEGEQSLQFGNATALKFTISDQDTEDVPVVTSPKRGPAKAASASGTTDISKYITKDSTMSVTIGGKEYSMADLETTGKEVPEGSGVSVRLYFDTIKNIPAGNTLTYQIPSALAMSENLEPTDVLDAQTGEVLGSFVIGSDGLITITIDQDYHTKFANPDGSLTLHGFNLYFYGSFSSSAGQEEGSEDNIISFTGSHTADDVFFRIPFDYKNDRANVQITKDGDFNVQTRTISYTVTVTAPSDNTEDAYNVKVTDYMTPAVESFIEPDTDKDNKDNLYRTATTTNGTFNPATGVWTISGDMKPGTSYTLTYDLVVKKDYFTNNPNAEVITNKATVTFNECGLNDATDIQSAAGTALVEKSCNNTPTLDENGTYLTYTLKVSAHGATMTGIVVEDVFDTPGHISSIVVDDADAASVVINNESKSFKWTVGDLNDGEDATLTYKAYLNPYAWAGASENYYTKAQTNTQTVRNTATVTVNNSPDGSPETGEVPVVTDSTTYNSQIQKMWLQKTGSLLDNGQILFTVTANGSPTADNVASIYDNLTGGTYVEDGVITVKRYKSDSDTKETIDTTKINVADVLNADKTGWNIDLTKVTTTDGETKNISGRYYYVVNYYVNAPGAKVTNQAGLGVLGGPGIVITKEIQGASGWTKNTDFKKDKVSISYKTGEIPNILTLYKTAPRGLVAYDHTSTSYCYDNGYAWFDDDAISRIVVKAGDTVLEEGVDYSVAGDTTGITSSNCMASMKDKYSGFKVKFLRDVAASKAAPITISYVMKFHNEVLQQSDYQVSKGTPWVSNYFNISYPVGDDLQDAIVGGGQDQWWYETLPYNIPLKKSNGTYDKANGTISWTIEVNSQSTLGGDATLYDLLPEGLTFESAYIQDMGVLAGGDTTDAKARPAQTTINGKGKGETIKASDCTVEDYTDESGQKYSRVKLSIKALSRFECYSGGQIKENTFESAVKGWGKVTIVITAKVNADVLMSDQAATFVNTAILTDNDYLPGSVTATGSATVPATGETILSKSKANVDAPAYVQFALNINTNSLDLVDGDGDVVVDDVMGEGMSMATAHKDSFKVYNVTGKDIADDAGKLSVTKVVANGTDVTDQCSWTNVTTEATQPSYQFTVPDSMHVVIVYWAAFSGIAGQQVDVTNSAYYSYNGKDYSNNNSSWSGSVNVQGAGADAYANPYFYLQKQDQWGNNVSGAVFAVFKYNSASGEYDTLVSERTTLNGLAYIGHNVTDSSDSFAKLQMNTIYKIKEISSPVGYKLDNTEHYFEFVDLSNGGTVTVTDEVIAAHVAEKHGGLTVVDMTPGGTYTVTNTFTGASYQIPVKKTINRESIHSTVDFTFNLTQVAADDGSMLPVYTDEDYKVAMPSSGIKATITGSGTTDFTTLHFKSAGTYAFTMTENDLSKDASDRGYSKDTSTYKVVVVVSESNNALSVTSVTYTSDSTEYAKGDILENGDVPTFDNTLSLVGSLNLQVKKVVSGRATEVKADEFSFTVTDNSTGQTIKDSDGNDLVFKTQEGGLVDITIPLSHKDIGTKRYIIREVVPADADKDTSIGYTASPVIAKVTIGEITAAESPNGQAGVAATSKVTYTADKKEDGVPLMVNEYHATGSLKLEGTKKLMYGSEKQAIKAGRFNFVVMEGNTQVATGTTNGEWEDNIDFTEIHYVAADIGTHTYTISEVDEGEMFVEYTDKTVTVTVEVKDAGGGELTVVPTYGGTVDEKDYRQHALFVNTCTFIIPTGIRLDVLPYVLIVLLALGCGALVLRRRKHMRG
jgi:hypothetical protein